MASAEPGPVMGVWGQSPAASSSRASGGGHGGKALMKLKAFCPFSYKRRA